jgi:hypothetical protein
MRDLRDPDPAIPDLNARRALYRLRPNPRTYCLAFLSHRSAE